MPPNLKRRDANHGRMRKESQALSAGTPEVCRPIYIS
jgi:hypothetical protein